MTTKQKKVLLVEDEVLIALAEKQELEKLGYQVVLAHSGKKALALFKQQSDIDLILMDINLGAGSDGTEIAIQILNQREVPIVFLSSHHEKEVVEKTEKITSYGYVVKNSGYTVLDASIKMAFKLFEANQRTAEQKQRLATILHSIGDAVIATNLEGMVTHLNPIAERLTGWDSQTAMGKPLQEIFTIVNAETLAPVANPVGKVLESGKIVDLTNHILLIAKDGTRCPIADSAAPIKDLSGQCTGVVLVFRDITERKAAEDALREERDRAQSYLDLAGVMFVALDHAGIVTMINRKGREILGCKNEEVIGKNWFDTCLPPQVNQQVKTVYQLLMTGEIAPVETFENPVLNRQGQERMISWHNTFLRNEAGTIIGTLSSGEDITEQRQAEAALKLSETKFRSITESATDFIFIKDRDRRYTFVNRAMTNLLGLPAEQLLGKTPAEIFGTEQGVSIQKIDDRSFSGETVNESRWLTIGDKSLCFNTIQSPLTWEKAEVTSIMGIVRDVTMLRHTQQQLETIFNLSLDMICIADIKTATFTKVNPAFTRILGYSEVELLARPFLELIHPDDLQPTIAVIEQNLKKGKQVLRFENRYRTKNGDYRWLDWSSHPIAEQGLTYAIAYDITERKSTEKELQRRERSAQHSLEIAQNRTVAILQLFETLYRNRSENTVAVNDFLPAVIDQVAADCQPRPEVNVSLAAVEIPRSIAFPLGIITHELLTNAVQHAYTDGKQGAIEIEVSQSDHRIILVVRDHGQGFPDIDTPLGFGMELVIQLLAQLRGSLDVEPIDGTICTLSLDL